MDGGWMTLYMVSMWTRRWLHDKLQMDSTLDLQVHGRICRRLIIGFMDGWIESSEFLVRKMTGQMDEWMDELMDVSRDSWMGCRRPGSERRCMQGWIGEWEQEYLNGFMDGL